MVFSSVKESSPCSQVSPVAPDRLAYPQSLFLRWTNRDGAPAVRERAPASENSVRPVGSQLRVGAG
jgi:hypothetical protein